MRIVMSGRHVEVSNEVRDHIQTKARRLSKYYDRIHEIEAILGHESDQFSVELIVRADNRNTFLAKGTGPDTFAVVDGLIDKLERQLTKHKEKLRTRKGNQAADGNSMPQ